MQPCRAPLRRFEGRRFAALVQASPGNRKSDPPGGPRSLAFAERRFYDEPVIRPAMLFNSLLFLIVFLPAARLVYAVPDRLWPEARVAALLALSAVFYGLWDLGFLVLLAVSIGLNWVFAESFVRTGRGGLVSLAIALDLALLGAFKYLGFVEDLVRALHGPALPGLAIGLPLGISFFTFQHIMYLSDLRAGRTSRVGLARYALFIAFFPRVIAGPLVRPKQFFPQLDRLATAPPMAAEQMARGLLLLTFGLAKKVFIGDTLGTYVDPVFTRIAAGAVPTIAECWQVTLGYTFQLYFDFSGYTDMALGLALLFGIVLPENFQAPYRASSIQDFWRRWHITLSLFLRDYLYVPFGGNRHGLPRQILALLATMTLGGLWHGAGWTFVAWGALHGVALAADLLWRKARLNMPAAAGWCLTFAFVALAWVLFRAPSFGAALSVYAGLLGHGPLGTPPALFWPAVALAAALATAGPTAFDLAHRLPPTRWTAFGAALLFAALLLWVGNDTNAEFIYAQF